MTDIDIERMHKFATALSADIHEGIDAEYGGTCPYLYSHSGCAMLALIECLKKTKNEPEKHNG